jgi:hypothetical protein
VRVGLKYRAPDIVRAVTSLAGCKTCGIIEWGKEKIHMVYIYSTCGLGLYFVYTYFSDAKYTFTRPNMDLRYPTTRHKEEVMKRYIVWVLVLMALVTGCSQSNESKIIGTWRTLPYEDLSHAVRVNGKYTFFKGGGIKIAYEFDSGYGPPNYTSKTGTYKFEDENNVSYVTDAQPMQITSVSFPEKDRMKFGNQELGRIK